MDYTIIPQERNWQAHPTKAFPEGLYIDNTTGEAFASTELLAHLTGQSSNTIHEFVESDPIRRDAAAIVPGAVSVRVHPKPIVRLIVKEYKPDLYDDLKWLELEELLRGLAELVNFDAVEPISDDTQQQWTLYEWMIGHCEIVLEAKLFNKFKSKVHRLYKETYRRDPRTSYRNQAKNPSQVARLQVYTPTEFPVLQVCYMRTLAEVRCS